MCLQMSALGGVVANYMRLWARPYLRLGNISKPFAPMRHASSAHWGCASAYMCLAFLFRAGFQRHRLPFCVDASRPGQRIHPKGAAGVHHAGTLQVFLCPSGCPSKATRGGLRQVALRLCWRRLGNRGQTRGAAHPEATEAQILVVGQVRPRGRQSVPHEMRTMPRSSPLRLLPGMAEFGA